jgi:hypothetical protein
MYSGKDHHSENSGFSVPFRLEKVCGSGRVMIGFSTPNAEKTRFSVSPLPLLVFDFFLFDLGIIGSTSCQWDPF